MYAYKLDRVYVHYFIYLYLLYNGNDVVIDKHIKNHKETYIYEYRDPLRFKKYILKGFYAPKKANILEMIRLGHLYD